MSNVSPDSIDNMPLGEVEAAIASMEGYFQSCRECGQGINSKETIRYRKLRERKAELTPNELCVGDTVKVNCDAFADLAIHPKWDIECEVDHMNEIGQVYVWPEDRQYNGRYVFKQHIIKKVRCAKGWK